VTIYRLYAENGHRAGFWVQHRSWSNTCAQVQSVAGRSEGALPGPAPQYDHSEVLMRVFDVRSGRPIDSDPVLNPSGDKNYARIARPYWYDAGGESRAALRHADGSR
jgi:hypothetical protein